MRTGEHGLASVPALLVLLEVALLLLLLTGGQVGNTLGAPGLGGAPWWPIRRRTLALQ